MKKIIVIGASQGLGLALTRSLLEAGCQTAAGVLGDEALAPLKEQYPDQLLVFPGDVTDMAQLKAGAAQCEAFMGQADAVCVVAGVLLPKDRVRLLHECDLAELEKTFQVNTFGPIRAAQSFLPVLRPGGQFFVVTSEGVGIKSCGTWVPCYGLSKAAATKVCGILNASYPQADFYAVHPGRMNTEMGRTTAQIEPEETAASMCRILQGEIPLQRESWYIDYKGEAMEA